MSRHHIICAFAEPASGAGWSNSPIWIVTKDSDGNMTLESLQPEEQTEEMRFLYGVSAAVHSALTTAVERLFEKKK